MVFAFSYNGYLSIKFMENNTQVSIKSTTLTLLDMGIGAIFLPGFCDIFEKS